MAKKITMRAAREILACLFARHLSQRKTSTLLGIDRTVIARIDHLLKEAGLTYPLPDHITDEDLERIFYPPTNKTIADKPVIDFEKIQISLQIKGSTLTVLHEEWIDEAPDQNKLGYQQFCRLYRAYQRKMRISMRRMDEFGEFCYVDYSGLRPSYINTETRERVDCELFIGVLGGSKYTFAEATHTQRLEDWQASHIRMFAYFGGVPHFVVPDNLKSGVTKADRFFPHINDSYKTLCEHYGTIVFPARARKPKDKPAAEGGVLLAQRWILFRLRSQTFFSLGELNKVISALLTKLNEKQFQKLQGSRFSRWMEYERPALNPLPATPAKIAKWGKARAGADYVINVEGSFYSVPHGLRNQEVDYKLSEGCIEIFHNQVPVSAHPRSNVAGKVCISPDHQPTNHRAVSNWSKDDALAWAQNIGPGITQLLQLQLAMSRNHLVAYRTTEGLKSLCKKYGQARVEEVCTYAVKNNIFTMPLVREILSKKLDRLLSDEEHENPAAKHQHENIRGADHYIELLKKSEESERNE